MIALKLIMNRRSERRLVENELLFRAANRQVQKHITAERTPRSESDGMKLHFYCECSNLACTDRILLTADEYRTAGPDRKEFIVLTGHENSQIEDVIRIRKDYTVVKKHLDPAVISADY